VSEALNDLVEDRLALRMEEIAGRGLRLVVELDPEWQPRAVPGLSQALARLLELVFSTVPDESEIYLGSARRIASVARIEEGCLTLRWQVAGERRAASEPGATPLRPRLGDAGTHLSSAMAERARQAFAAAGWILELDAAESGGELVARVRLG
jgi:hypothetical protein